MDATGFGNLIGVAIEETPKLIALLKDVFGKKHPDTAQPTDLEIVVAWNTAFTSSLNKDQAWLAAHPSITPAKD